MNQKKILMTLLLLVIPLLLFSCKDSESEPNTEDTQEAIVFIGDDDIDDIDELKDIMPLEDYSQFAVYTNHLTIPDFLTEQQADLYKKAAILHYIFTSDPSEIDAIPLLDNAAGDISLSEITQAGQLYGKSIGRYRRWEDFKELSLSIFTPEYFEKLNKNSQFIEHEEYLYILHETEIVQMSLSYAPWHEPDKFELISSSGNEIIFTVTGYYFENANDKSSEITHLTVEIILTLTESGWRFSQFATAGNPFIF